MRLASGAKTSSASLTSALTTAIADAFSIAYPRALLVAAPEDIGTTVGVAFTSGQNGPKVPPANASTSPTYSRFPAGITQFWKLIVSTLIKDTNRGTFASTRGARGLSEASARCSKELLISKPVYDLANAGPRKRFTVLSNEGPILVHNCELAFGYQGALNAWLNFDSSGRHTDERIIEICKAWRAEHPAVVAFWRGLERAAIEAVRQPGRETNYREVGFEVDQEFLSMILPNGKRIWYYQPQLRTGMPQWHNPVEDEECRAGTCRCKPVPKLTYMAQKEGQWRRVYTYGGKLAENWTQATAREIMKAAERRLHNAGYSLILSIYDEAVSEDPIGFGSTKEYGDILRVREPWFADWPIGVDVWEGDRYKK